MRSLGLFEVQQRKVKDGVTGNGIEPRDSAVKNIVFTNLISIPYKCTIA